MQTILKENGNKKVEVTDTKYRTELRTTRNGRSWSVCHVDVEQLKMIRSAINEYLEQVGEKNGSS